MRRLYRELMQQSLEQQEPTLMSIELTYRCNYRCSFCYVDHSASPNELDVKTWTRILEDIKTSGCIALLLTGGEPSLHKGYMTLLRTAKDLGFLTSTFTNGSLIDRSMAFEMSKLNLGQVGITLYGATAETHDSFTGVRGSFDHVTNLIPILRDLGCTVQIKWNAVDAIVNETDAMIDLAESLGVVWSANGVIMMGRDGHCRGRVSDHDLLKFYLTLIRRFQTLEENLIEAERVATNWPLPKDPEAKICGAGHASGRIDPEGILYPCVDIYEPIADLKTERLQDIWHDSPVRSNFTSMRLKDFPHCMACGYYNACKYICPGAWKNETGSYYGVTRDRCRNTPSYLNAMNQYLNETVGQSKNPIRHILEEINEQGITAAHR